MQSPPSAWLHRCVNNSAISQLPSPAKKSAPPWGVCAFPLRWWTLELISMAELKKLCSQFPSTAFVCVHRLADDQMWTEALAMGDRKSTRLNSSHLGISYAVFCL